MNNANDVKITVQLVSMTGTLKFWNEKKKYGVVVTTTGDVFFHASKTSGKLVDLLKEDAVITMDVMTEFKNDQYLRTAMAVTNVTLPEIRTVWTSVATWNETRCSATVHLGDLDLIGLTAFISKAVIQKSTVLPGVGMPMRAQIKKTPQGWNVIAYESDESVAADYKVYMAEMLARVEALKSSESVAIAEVTQVEACATAAKSKRAKVTSNHGALADVIQKQVAQLPEGAHLGPIGDQLQQHFLLQHLAELQTAVTELTDNLIKTLSIELAVDQKLRGFQD